MPGLHERRKFQALYLTPEHIESGWRVPLKPPHISADKPHGGVHEAGSLI
jgi:hypothetical protein